MINFLASATTSSTNVANLNRLAFSFRINSIVNCNFCGWKPSRKWKLLSFFYRFFSRCPLTWNYVQLSMSTVDWLSLKWTEKERKKRLEISEKFAFDFCFAFRFHLSHFDLHFTANDETKMTDKKPTVKTIDCAIDSCRAEPSFRSNVKREKKSSRMSRNWILKYWIERCKIRENKDVSRHTVHCRCAAKRQNNEDEKQSKHFVFELLVRVERNQFIRAGIVRCATVGEQARRRSLLRSLSLMLRNRFSHRFFLFFVAIVWNCETFVISAGN